MLQETLAGNSWIVEGVHYQILFEWNNCYDKHAIRTLMEITDKYEKKRIIVKRNEEI